MRSCWQQNLKIFHVIIVLQAKHKVDKIMFKSMWIDCIPQKESTLSAIIQPSWRTPMPFYYNTPTNMAPFTNLPSSEIKRWQSASEKVSLQSSFSRAEVLDECGDESGATTV